MALVCWSYRLSHTPTHSHTQQVVYNQTGACKNKKEGDITLHYIDILAMYCRVLSPSFLYLQFKLCDIRIVDLTRSCKPLVLPFIQGIDETY